jgi:hypothetical protein
MELVRWAVSEVLVRIPQQGVPAILPLSPFSLLSTQPCPIKQPAPQLVAGLALSAVCSELLRSGLSTSSPRHGACGGAPLLDTHGFGFSASKPA